MVIHTAGVSGDGAAAAAAREGGGVGGGGGDPPDPLDDPPHPGRLQREPIRLGGAGHSLQLRAQPERRRLRPRRAAPPLLQDPLFSRQQPRKYNINFTSILLVSHDEGKSRPYTHGGRGGIARMRCIHQRCIRMRWNH